MDVSLRRGRLALGLLLALLSATRGAAQEPAAAPALRVFVVRHAQAWKNVPAALRPGRMSDEQLDALTPKGLAKAAAIGNELAGRDISMVYASPAHRAEQTAEAIAQALGLAEPPIVDAAFAPLSAGTDRAALDWRWRTRNFDAGKDPRPTEGESLADGLARAMHAIDGIAARRPGSTVVVVTHGEIAAALLGRAAGTPVVSSYRKNFIDEGAVREIEIDASGWRLVPTPKEH